MTLVAVSCGVVALDAAVSRVAERELAKSCPAEVWNAGVGGYSTDQEYIDYVDRGRHWRPDLVLLFFFYNDVLINARDNYWGTPVPLLAERDGRLVVANEPVGKPPRREGARSERGHRVAGATVAAAIAGLLSGCAVDRATTGP